MGYNVKSMIKRYGVGGIASRVARKISRKVVFGGASRKARQNTLVFFSRPDFSDNARVLFERIVQRGVPQGYKLVWAFEQEPTDQARRAIGSNAQILVGAKADAVVARARFVFGTHGCPVPGWYQIPEDQTLVNLWHGCSFKAGGESDTRAFAFSCVLVPGPLFVDTKSRFFGCPEEQVWPLGYPRYDLLRSPDARQQLEKLLPGCTARKTVMWMPTFRKNTSSQKLAEENTGSATGLPLIETAADLQQLDALCEKLDVQLVVKRHRLQVAYSALSNGAYRRISFVDDADLDARDVELYQLLPAFDALVTDYSSIGIDYLLVDKPMAFVVDDYQEYKAARGFIVDDPLQYMAGQHCASIEQLGDFLRSVAQGEDAHANWRAKVRQVALNECAAEEGGYSDRLLALLQQRCGFPLLGDEAELSSSEGRSER